MQSFQTAPTDRTFQAPATDILEPKVTGSENLIKDTEFHFRSQIQRRLRLLHRFSYGALAVSIYELIFSSTSLGLFPNSFNTISTIAGLITLILSITMIVWSSKALKTEESETLSTSDLLNGNWEAFHQVFYVGLMFRAALSLPIIANMLLQKDYTAQYLAAQDRNLHGDPSNLLNNLATPLPLLELLLCLVFIQGTRTVFSYIERPNHAITRMVFIGSLVLLASSFSLILSSEDALAYQGHYSLSSQFPNWILQGSVVIGTVSALLTGLVWLVNHTKWRVPHLVVSGLFVLLTVTFAFYSFESYKHSHQVSRFYEDTSDLQAWRERMASVDRQDIESFGCPTKYFCQGSLLEKILPGEKTEEGESMRCLNTACAGLLGQFQSSPFLAVSNWSLVSLSSGIIILMGLIFSWRLNWRDQRSRDKSDYKWLGFLLLIFLAFGAFSLTHNKPFIRESQMGAVIEEVKEVAKAEEGGLRGTIAQIKEATSPSGTTGEGTGRISTVIEELGNEKSFVPVLNSQTNKFNMTNIENSLMFAFDKLSPYHDAFKALIAKKYRFLTIKHDPFKPEKVRILAGPWKLSFDNFSNSIEKKREQVGFVYIEHGGKEKLYMVVFAPRNSDPVDVLKGLQLPVDTNAFKNENLKDVSSIIFSDVNDITLENVVANSRAPGPVVDLPPEPEES